MSDKPIPAGGNDRRHFIGGSDLSAICGLSPWRDAFTLALEKTGRLPPETGESLVLRRGQILEAPVAQLYAEMTGADLLDGIDVVGPEPWQRAQIDRRERLADDSIIPVEIKTSAARIQGLWGASGTDEVPTYYASQLHWQMRLMGAPMGRLVAMLALDDVRVYTLMRDPVIDQFLLDKATAFWKMIQSGNLPDPDFNHPSIGQTLERLFRDFTPTEIVKANPAILAWKHVLEEAKAKAKQYEAVVEGARNHLLHFMGSAAILDFEDGTCFERRQIHRDGYTVGPTDYTEMRLKKMATTTKRLKAPIEEE